MFELVAIAWGSFLVAFSGALMPGPVLAVTIAGSRQQGFWFGPRVVLGHGLVELPVVVLLSLPLGLALGHPWVVMAIAYLGGTAMVWLGVGMLLQSRHTEEGAPEALGLRLGGVGSGVLTSVANPYWYLWWVCVGGALITKALAIGWLGVAAFFVAHISGDLVWYASVSWGVAKGRQYLRGRLYKALLMICALLLLVLAARFLLLGLSKTIGFDLPPFL
jgi:threonine/homoserine/homoserine lactone efflux protein